MKSPSHWKELDGMRGVLALGIVLLHFGFNGLAKRTLGWNGIEFDLAVDVFFLLSGFVLAHSGRNGVDPRTFAIKRFWRLFPVFFATTIVAIFASPHSVSPLELLMAVPLTGAQPVNFPAWSIFWEFYLPVLIVFAPLRVPDRLVRPMLAVCLLGLGWACVGVAGGERPDLMRAGFGLASGYLLYRSNITVRAPFLPSFAATCGVLAVAAYVPMAAMLVPLFASLSVLSGRNARTVFSSAPIQLLGTMSYTIYLSHIPVLMWMQHTWGSDIDGNFGAKICGLLATFLVAGLLTFTVEKPLMKLGRFSVASTAP